MTNPTPIEQQRRSKAGAKKRRNRIAARRRAAAGKPYQSAARPAQRRARTNRKADRFDVDEGRGWIMVRPQSARFAQCAEVLRSAGCPVFEARHEVRTAASGAVRVTNPPMLRRLLFVGVDAPEQACLLAGLDYVEAIFCRGEGAWFWADEIAVQGARPAVIGPAMMSRFANHITGHMKGGEEVGDFIETLYALGQMVRVVDGPFASLPATVGEIFRDQGRYSVDVSMFGRVIPVELAEDQLEAA